MAGIGFSSTTIGVLAYDDPYDVPKFTQEEINAEMNKLNNMTQDEIDAQWEKAEEKAARDLNSNQNLMAAKATSTYPKSEKGKILATKDNKTSGWAHGHAAIIYSSSNVVEALPGSNKGVVVGSNNWNTSKDTCWALGIRKTTNATDAKAADWAYNKRGLPYSLLIDKYEDKKFYCSQLVFRSYLAVSNWEVSLVPKSKITVTPMDLVNSADTFVKYKK